jgi:hypothetical protein
MMISCSWTNWRSIGQRATSRFEKLSRNACPQAGLKPIKMYNLRHSFGTRLVAKGVDVRTIQGLMRHARLNTTEQYMAYAPRPELANQITRALDPASLPENVVPIRPTILATNTTLLRRLEEVPASGYVRSSAYSPKAVRSLSWHPDNDT